MTRRLIWTSDIHLNFLTRSEIVKFCETLSVAGADGVLIGGDLSVADDLEDHLLMLASRLDTPVYFVLGNHDYYGSSIADVNLGTSELVSFSQGLRWLAVEEPVSITDDTALIGHRCWADGRLGDYRGSNVKMADYELIDELIPLTEDELLARLNALGDEAAEWIGEALHKAGASHRRIIVLTHVPPFREATWHEGRTSGDDWLPHFSCKAAGDVLLDYAANHPDRELLVLSGHTHSQGIYRALPNLVVKTGAAEYGNPGITEIIEVD